MHCVPGTKLLMGVWLIEGETCLQGALRGPGEKELSETGRLSIQVAPKGAEPGRVLAGSVGGWALPRGVQALQELVIRRE